MLTVAVSVAVIVAGESVQGPVSLQPWWEDGEDQDTEQGKQVREGAGAGAGAGEGAGAGAGAGAGKTKRKE